MTDTPRVKLPELIDKTLNQAFALGQTYWQQADSKSYSENRKADVTFAKLAALKDETRAAVVGNAVAGLVEVFRERAKNASYSDEADQAYKDCADELEAALQGDSDDGR